MLKDELKNIFCSSKLQYRTLQSIQNALKNVYSKPPSLSWIYQSLKNVKVSRRKFYLHSVSSNNHERMEVTSHAFKTTLSTLQNEDIVCLDETAFVNHNNPCYGYFQKVNNLL